MHTVDEVLNIVRSLPPVDRDRLRTELEALAAEESDASNVDDFWHDRSVEELASLQGVTIPKTLDEVLGQGTDLWEDGAAFDSFVHGIYERRREGRDREGSSA